MVQAYSFLFAFSQGLARLPVETVFSSENYTPSVRAGIYSAPGFADTISICNQILR